MLKKFAVVLIVSGLSAACTTTRAQAPIERPALDVPPVPPRVIEPMPQPQPAQPEPVGELPPERTTKPKPQPQRDTSKAESKPETPPAEPATQPPAVPPQQPVPPLRTGTIDVAEATRQVREILGRARTLLENTDFQKLSEARQALYKNAQMLIQESEAAIKAQNLELARKLADKADTIAKELQNR